MSDSLVVQSTFDSKEVFHDHIFGEYSYSQDKVRIIEAFKEKLEKLDEVFTKYWIVSDSSSITSFDFFCESKLFNLCHDWAHYLLSKTSSAADNITLTSFNTYGFNWRVFRLTSRLSYSPDLILNLQENLRKLGIPIYLNTNGPFLEVPYGLDQSIQLNPCCFDELTDISDEEYCQLFPKCCETSFLEQLVYYVLQIAIFISLLKKLTVAAIQLQYIANAIRNKISRSPTPYKKEPPIGGVKVGGEHYHNTRHVARTLYLRQLLSAMT